MEVIIARPGEEAVIEEVMDGYDGLEHAVGGKLEFVWSPVEDTVIVCDRWAKKKGKMPNRYIFGTLSFPFIEKGEDVDIFAGTIVIAGHENGKLASLTEEKLNDAMEIYRQPHFKGTW